MPNKKFLTYILITVCLSGMLFSHDASALTAEEQFYKADFAYKKFLKDTEKAQYRENWLVHIKAFQRAYRADDRGTLAPAALYMTGAVYRELYRHSFRTSDKKKALDIFRRVVKHFADSVYKDKARKALKDFSREKTKKTSVPEKKEAAAKKTSGKKPKEVKTKVRSEVFRKSKEVYKRTAKTSSAKPKLPKKPKKSSFRPEIQPTNFSPATITKLRFWSNPSYTRIVVDADRDAGYTYELLEKKEKKQPHRLYIDFENSRLGQNIKHFIPINDDLLTGTRASQYKTNLVRVVVDIKSFGTYKVFSLRNPFRTIIDVWGGDVRDKTPKPERRPDPKQTVPSFEPGHGIDLAKQLALGVRRIVIDPGHGGRDAGALGYDKGVKEKNVVLDIAKRLARKIRRKLGCEVIMTRTTDVFLSLEERTAIANTKSADLFISIHTNAHKKRSAYGIETYFLNLATDEDAIRVAARENATTKKNISDLQKILNDLMQNAKINESSRLAADVQKSLYKRIKSKYSKVRNKGVKQAPFYVLLGAQMPSILIETSFISNKRECRRLTNSTYQEHLCEAIVNGIRKYIKETNPTALLRLRRGNG